MDDRSKNKDQLINELEQMRQRVAVLERTETENRRIQGDLKKQNDELQFILDSVPAYIFYKDREGRLIRGNAAVARSADMPKEGWVGKTVFDLVPGLAESYYEDDMEVMTSGEPKRNIIEPFDTPKGVRWLRTTKIPTKDKEGTVNGLVGFSVDITDRMRAEEALRESEEKLRTIFDSSSDGIVVVDLEGKVVEVNQAALRMTGYSRDGVIGRNALDLIIEGERSEAMGVMTKIVQMGEEPAQRVQYTLVAADGKEFMAEFGLALLRDSFGNATGFVGSMRDVTERRRAEMELQSYRDRLERMVEERTADLTVANKQLKQEVVNRKRAEVAMKDSEERLRTTFESMGEGVLIVDLRGNIAEANRAALNMAKCSKKELIGRSIFQFIAPDERTQAMSELGAILAAGINRADLEYTFVDAEGKRIDAEFSATLLRDSGGNPAGIIGIARDLTERKRMEKTLRESEEKLRFMFESIGDAIVVIDLNGKIIEVNERLVAMSGYESREQVLGEMPLNSLLRGFALGQWKISRTGDRQVSATVEYVAADRYGREFYVEANGAMLRDAAGKPIGFIIALRDVSERKRMEKALREGEARYRELYKHMTSGVIVYEAVNDGEDFVAKDFNSAAERISKLRREDFIGKSFLQAKPGIKKSGLFYVMQEVWRTGEPQYIPESHYEDESISGWRENFIYKLPSGEVVTVYNDITDRKRMEEALRESEMKFRTIFETIPDGVTVTDLEGRIVDQNQAGMRLGGYNTKGEVTGLSSFDLIIEEDRPRAVAEMPEVLETGLSPIKQYRMRRKDGWEFDAEVIAATMRGSFGSPTGLIVLTRDITERKRMQDALIASEEKLRIVFDAITDGIAVTDLQINVVQANEAVTRMAGYSSKDEVIGKNALEWIAPDDLYKATGSMNEALKGQPIESGEFRIRNAQGAEFLGDVGISPLRDSSGNLSGFVTVIRDVTERRWAEEALRLSEEKYRSLVDHMQEGYLIVRGEHIKYANERCADFLGIPVDKIIGKSIWEFIVPADVDKAKQTGEVFNRGGATPLQEFSYYREDGRMVPLEVNLKTVSYESQPALAVVLRDITERKQMEREIRGSEEKLRLMFETIRDGVVLTDISGKIIDVNEAIVRIGRHGSKEKLMGRIGFDLVADKDRDRLSKAVAASLAGGGAAGMWEAKFTRGDGTEFDAEMTGAMMRDSTGKPAGLIGVIRDITDRKSMEEALRGSEEKLRFMFASMIDAVVVVDLEGKVTELNDAGLRMTGYSRREGVIGKNAFDFIAEEDRARAVEDLAKSLETAPGFMVQYKFVDKDGKEYEVEAAGSMLFDSDGNVTGFINVVRDITERKRMQEELRTSEEKLRAMFNSIGDAVTITDLQGIILDENDAAVRMAGFDSKDEVIGKNGFELIDEKDRARAIDTMLSGFKHQDTLTIEYALLRKDGSQWEAEASLALMRDSSGKPTGIVAITKDITERKRIQEELKKSEEKLRAIFESIGDAIIVIGIDGSVQDVNAEACRMLGCRDKAEALGRRGWEFLTDGDRSRSKEYASRLFAEGRAETMEFMLRDLDGRDIYVESRATIMRDTAGKPVGLVGISRDVTERRRMEEALRESEEKLRTMFEAIEDGITVTDLKGNIVQHNEAARQMLGYGRRDKFIGRKGFGFIAKKDRTRAEQYMRSAIENERGGTIEYSLLAKDGTEIDAEVHTALIRGSSGNPNGLVGVARDITERKRMQEELRESEEKLRFMFDSIADGMILVDLSGNVQEVNAAATRMAGYSDKEEMIGRNAFDFIAERDRDRALAENMKNIAEGRGSTVVYTAVDRNGAELTVEAMGAMLRDVAGNPIGFITVIRDITERMRMQEALRESEEKLRFMFESMGDAIVVIDLEGKITEVNERLIAMSGYESREEVLGEMPLNSLLRGFAQGQWRISRHLERQVSATVEYVAMDRHGRGFDVEANGAMLRDAAGKPVGSIIALRDVSERKLMEQKLRESEEKLRFMFESIADGIVSVDLEGNIRDVNPAFMQMTGHGSKEDIVGRGAFDLVVERDRAKALEQFARGIESEQLASLEYSVKGKSGREFDAEVSAGQVRDRDGKPAGFIVAVRDVSERKRMQEALRESEEKLRTILDTSPDFVMSLDHDGKLRFINRTVPEMTVEQTIGTSAYDYIAPEARETYKKTVEQIFLMGEPATIETSGLGPGGRTSYYETRFAPVLHDGKVVSITLISTDITERKLAGEALRESEEKLRFMFESMGDSIVVIDVEGKVIEMNEKLIAMSGYESREEVLGRNAFEFVSERDRAKAMEDFTRNMERQISATIEYTAVDRYGREFDVEANGAMLRDAAGKTVGFIIALRDVSERKIMEQKLKDSEEMSRGMLESAATGIYLVQNGKFEYVSPMFATISGYTNDELIGTQALDYVHPDDREMVREKAIESLKGKSGLPYEFRFVRKDGTIVWILEKVASIQYKGKRATIASFMDITEHRRADQALRESQEKLRSFMDSATDYFTIWDAKLNLVDLNEAALHYPLVDFPGKIQRESVIGKGILRLEPTIRETDRYDRYMEVIRTGKPFFAEDIIPHTKLGDIHMAISAFRVGEGLGIITTDVTERRRSEEELRKSKVALEKRTNQLLALQKVTASIQSTLSLSDVLQQVAEGVVDNLGYDQSMVLVVDEKADVYQARAFFSKDRKKYREGVESIMEQALSDIKFPRKRGYSMGLDESMDGKVVITPNFSALAVPPLDKQQSNAIQKFLGANTIVSMPLFAMERHVGGILAFTARDDIAEPDIEPLRLLADQAGVAIVNANIYEGAAEMAQRLAVTGTLSRILGSSLDIREVYKAFVEEIHNVIDFERASIALVEGDRLRFLAVSPDVEPGGGTMMPVAGSPTEWVIQQKRTNIEHDLAVERQFSIYSVYAEEGMRSAISVPLISKGEAFGSFDLVSRSPNAYGEREQGILEQVAGSVAAAIENSRLFIRIKEHEAELVKAYEELKKAQEYMVQAERLRALGELAGGVAHDFNNVLAIILGRAQLALEDVEDAKLKKDLQIIEQTALDAATTVRRLQDFARVRVDRGFETVDLNEVVEGALQMVESRRMELKETRGVIIDVNADLGEVPSVQGEAAELREALVNIIFNAIDAMPKGGSITVKSRQDKEGVLLSVSDTGEGIPDDVKGKIFDPFFTTRPQKGSGLGLSVTYGIITRHGGRIEVESAVGKGATFYIWLPMAIGVKAAKRPEQKVAGVKSAEVLLVDDDPEVSEVLQRMLQQMGHRVTGVNSGEEAVNAFEAGHYDLVVTDLGMPDMSGREVAAAVKDIKPGTPVLLITGWGVQLDPSELPEIDGIVAKPFSKEVLREQLAKLLPAEDGGSKEKPRKKKGPR